MVYKSGQIFLPFCHKSRVWWTDGQTDGQTELSALDRVCILCSAVKIQNERSYFYEAFSLPLIAVLWTFLLHILLLPLSLR